MRSIAVAALAVFLAGAAARADGTRVAVPIRQTMLSDGTPRYSVPISVGGSAIDAMLDTGSFGLRVMSSALSSGDYRATEARRRFPFGGGAVFEGPIAQATVAIGGLATPTPIGIQVVRSVGCTQRKPNCPAARIPFDRYGMGGDGLAGQGFGAILGTSLRRAPAEIAADNPLPALPASSWIVVLPRPGDAEPGRLILNPTADETARFALFKLDPQPDAMGQGAGRGWADARLPGCLKEGDGAPYCAPTLLDSGADAVIAMRSEATGERRAAPGTSAELTFTQAGTTLAVPFVTEQGPASRLVTTPPSDDFGPRIQAGILPFYSYAVLYDAGSGAIGFGPRPAP